MPLITSVPFFINAPQFDMCAPRRAAPLRCSRLPVRFNIMYDTDNYVRACGGVGWLRRR